MGFSKGFKSFEDWPSITKDARCIGLSKMQMFRLKKEIKEGKKIILKKKTINKLMKL